MLKPSRTIPLTDKVAEAMRALNIARANGDALKIELAEAALNDLLDRLPRPDTSNACNT